MAETKICARCGRNVHGATCAACEGSDLTLWELVLVAGAVLLLFSPWPWKKGDGR